MKFFFLFLFLILSGGLKASQERLLGQLDRWTESDEVEIPYGAQKGTVRSYTRFVKTKEHVYSIGTVQYFKIPKTALGKVSIGRIISQITKSMEFKNPLKRKVGNAEVLEAHWPEARRNYKLFVQLDEHFLTYSVAFTRTSYGPNLQLETELLQRTLHQVDVGGLVPEDVLTSFLRRFPSLIEKVYAQSSDPCAYCNGDPVCLYNCYKANGGTGGSNGGIPFDQILKNLETTNGQLTLLNSNIATANSNVSVFNKNHAETNQIMDKRWAETNQIMDKRWGESNEIGKGFLQEYSRTNSILKEAFDPKHAALLAAAAGAGAVVGSTAAGMAISGISAGLKFLGKWIRGDFKKMKEEEIFTEFTKAKKAYDQSQEASKKLEETIDRTLGMLRKYREYKDGDLLSIIDKKIAEQESVLKVDKSDLDEETHKILHDAEACSEANKEVLLKHIVGTTKFLDDLNMIKKHLTTAGNDPEKFLCAQLRDAFAQLAEAEGMMQNARGHLMEGAIIWKKRALAEEKETQSDIRKFAKPRFARRYARMEKEYVQDMKGTDYWLSFGRERRFKHDCNKGLKKLFQADERKHFCESLRKDPELLEHPLEEVARRYPDVSLEDFKRANEEFGLITRAKQVQYFRKNLADIYEQWDQNIDEHKKVSIMQGKLMYSDPYLNMEQSKAMDEFIQKIKSGQAKLFTDGLMKKKEKIREFCPDISAHERAFGISSP